MSDFLNYPAPSSYKDWQSWAAMLVQQLQNASQVEALSIPLYVADATKARGGYPSAKKADMIWILENNVRKLAIYDGTKWIKYSPDA